jgi:predicted nucleotidyltransferase
MLSTKFVEKVIKNDRKTFFKDLKLSDDKQQIKNDFNHNDSNVNNQVNSSNNFNNSVNNLDDFSSDFEEIPLIADFTEYNPLHKGHLHCLEEAKKKIPHGLFVAIVPGLFERSGRGVPYIMTRDARSQIAVKLGADVVVEGPPMGIMGSGQYSLCLALMFKALNADYIPRGYKPFPGFEKILDRIAIGKAVVPKPYKIVDLETKEVLLKGKLEEDNYVISSFSRSMNKINFDFKDKFIFVKRIEGVSGTLIRNATLTGDFSQVKDMLPQETIDVLKREINDNRAPLHNLRYEEAIIDNANNLSYDELILLNLIDENTAKNLVDNREIKSFDSIEDIGNSISQGFSTHFQQRVLSVLEAKINKDTISNYIDYYPSVVRVLNYKNKDILNLFKEKINDNYRRIEVCR